MLVYFSQKWYVFSLFYIFISIKTKQTLMLPLHHTRG